MTGDVPEPTDLLGAAAQAWRDAQNSHQHTDIQRYDHEAIGHLIAYLQGAPDDGEDAA